MDLRPYVPYVACLALGFVVGTSVGPKQTERIIEKPTIVQGKTEHTIQTKIVYVPKEVDPKTGQAEKTDVQANIGKPEVTVSVNGNEAVFKKMDEENFVFEKGKLQLDQSSKVSVDLQITPTIIDTTKHHAITLGAGLYGFGAGYRQDRWSGEIYSDWNRNIGVAVKYDLLQW